MKSVRWCLQHVSGRLSSRTCLRLELLETHTLCIWACFEPLNVLPADQETF